MVVGGEGFIDRSRTYKSSERSGLQKFQTPLEPTILYVKRHTAGTPLRRTQEAGQTLTSTEYRS